MHVAISSERDSFDGQNARSVEDLEKIRASYTADIRYVTDLLDELLCNERLFEAKREV